MDLFCESFADEMPEGMLSLKEILFGSKVTKDLAEIEDWGPESPFRVIK
jgi:hypothetical protein